MHQMCHLWSELKSQKCRVVLELLTYTFLLLMCIVKDLAPLPHLDFPQGNQFVWVFITSLFSSTFSCPLSFFSCRWSWGFKLGRYLWGYRRVRFIVTMESFS